MNKKVLSLRQIIFRIIFTVTAFIIIIQLCCISILFNTLDEQKQSAVESMASQFSQTIDDVLSSSSTLQEYAQHNSIIHNYLLEANSNTSSPLKLEISDNIMFINHFFSDKVTLALIDTHDKFHSLSSNISEAEEAELKKIYSNYKENQYSNKTVLFNLPSEAYKILYVCTLEPIRKTNKDSVSSETIGVSIVLNRINIHKTLSNMQNQGNAGVTVKNARTGIEIPFTDNISEGKAHVSSLRNISGTEWNITCSLIYANQSSFIYDIILMLFIELVILVGVILLLQFGLLNRFISTPIKSFIEFFDDYTFHDSKKRLSISLTKEYGSLSKHINIMLDNFDEQSREIFTTQQKLYEAALSEKDALFYALQNQINPHFIYNTLECINAMAISHSAPEITDITNSFSFILRYALDSLDNVSVEEEIFVLEKYLSIHKVRFPKEFKVDFDFDDDVWDKHILRMLFQPIVENSFKHGFSSSNKKYLLEISGRSEGDNLVFTFRDNGKGIEPRHLSELKQELEESDGMIYSDNAVGILNIHRRIQLRHGNQYGLEIDSVYGEYTCVTVTLPNPQSEV